MLREKLDSITEHMVGVHHFPENSEHKECAHGPVDETRRALLLPDSMVTALLVKLQPIPDKKSPFTEITYLNSSSWFRKLGNLNQVGQVSVCTVC